MEFPSTNDQIQTQNWPPREVLRASSDGYRPKHLGRLGLVSVLVPICEQGRIVFTVVIIRLLHHLVQNHYRVRHHNRSAYRFGKDPSLEPFELVSKTTSRTRETRPKTHFPLHRFLVSGRIIFQVTQVFAYLAQLG